LNDGDQEILEHFIRTREKTIELVRRTPEELLTRRAEGEGGPLNRLFIHIATGVDWWMHNVMRDGRGRAPGYGRDKNGILQALAASRDRLISFSSVGDGERMGQTFSRAEENGSTRQWAGRDRVLYLTDHEVHHRGKIVLALRQWGFTDIPFLPY